MTSKPSTARRAMIRTALASGVVFSLTGCATMVHGSTQRVSMSSEPPGATVFVDNRQVGVTPLDVDLSRHHTHSVRFEKAGFTTHEIPLVRKDSVWVAADGAWALVAGSFQNPNPAGGILTALVIWVGADMLMGGAFTLPSTVRATLGPVPAVR